MNCLCGETAYELVGERDERTVVRCSCGLVRTLNPPADYGTLYSDGTQYHEQRQTPRGLSTPNYRERFSHDYGVAMERWGQFMRQWRVLDVGSANGAWLACVSDFGVSAEGLELNPTIAAWSQGVTGQKVHTSWLRLFGRYDLITYHDVLEHCVDPVAELGVARAHCSLGGWLVVDTPDTADPRFAALGMQWHHMKPQEHLWFFNEGTLRAAVEAAGFTLRGVERPLQGKLVVYAQNLAAP